MTVQEILDAIVDDYRTLNVRTKRLESAMFTVSVIAIVAGLFSILALIRSLH